MHSEPQKEHEWLRRMEGRWTFNVTCVMGPDQPESSFEGREVVRSFGGLWIIGEGEGSMPGGGTSQSVITLGFDPKKGRFVGTFISSMMDHMWHYVGSLDADQKTLTLDTEGPSFDQQGMAKYQDIFTMVDDDHRTLHSQVLGADGKWTRFMSGHYHRQK